MRFYKLILFIAILASCSRNPSVLQETAGVHAKRTAELFWYFFSIESVIFFLVLGLLFFSLWRRRESKLTAPQMPSASTERRATFWVGSAIALTVLILTSFVALSYVVDQKLIDFDRNPEVSIEITAHQWWWEIRYLSSNPSEVFTTANEIHVPVNQAVRLILKSNDVVHSLWFPNLAGKRDIIPGRDQDLFLRVEKEGQWQGRCGEFCGMQHAFMGILLFSESKAAFDKWKTAQRLPAVEPKEPEEKRGQEVFQKSACVLCHAIRGIETSAQNNNAPDLTHLKSRTTIGSTAAQNTKAFLGGWILDPHGIKPGVHMPTVLQEPKDFQALLTYLETLK
jgi:cytochrome c oxidase subunit 2